MPLRHLLVFAFGREVAKAQLGLGLQTVTRTDRTGRTEQRHVRAGAAPADHSARPGGGQRPAAQYDLFGAPRLVAAATSAPKARRQAKAESKDCDRCGGRIGRRDEHARDGRCGACRRTIDWVAETSGHRTFASLHG